MTRPENQPTSVGKMLPAGFESLIPAGVLAILGDDAFWDEQDRAQEAAVRRQEAEEAKMRLSALRRNGAPKRAVERISMGKLDDTMAMAAMRKWGGGAIRVLSGGVGCGKTTAAIWWLAQYGGTEPLFVRANELEARGRYDHEMRALWKGASALCIDDVGAEYADRMGNWLSLLDEIADYFHGEMRPLIVTTNIRKAEVFRSRLGSRISSRIREGAGWCPVGGDDLRRRA